MIPEDWEQYTFKITYQRCLIEITVKHQMVKLRLLSGKDVQLKIYQKRLILSENPIIIPLKGTRV